MNLTKDNKERLIDAILRHRFQKDIDNLVKRENRLAARVYNKKFPKRERELIEEIPEVGVHKTGGILINIYDVPFELYYGGGRHFGAWDHKDILDKYGNVSRRDPLSSEQFSIKNGKLFDDIIAWACAYDDLVNYIGGAKYLFKVHLGKIRSVSRLIKDWPEIQPFIDALNITPANVPALPTDELNEMVGL